MILKRRHASTSSFLHAMVLQNHTERKASAVALWPMTNRSASTKAKLYGHLSLPNQPP